MNSTKSINPATGEIIGEFACAEKNDVSHAVDSAKSAFAEWSNLTYQERGIYLLSIANLIKENASSLAELETRDQGKTLKETTFIDIPTAAGCFEYFANAGNLLDGEFVDLPVSAMAQIRREPIGVIGQIIPWNYPLLMAAWKLAPALIAGNTVVLKPAELTSLTAIELAKIISKAGLPKGVVNILTGKGSVIGPELCKSEKVSMISFTGGTQTGKEILANCSGTVKKTVMELGGKSANIVFADTDFDAAVGGAMTAIFMNQGQMCTAGSRLLVEDKIYDKFVAALVDKTKNIKLGNGLETDTDMGPLVSDEHRKNVLSYIETGKKEGAKLLTGGKIPTDANLKNGFFLEPTIFEAMPGMKIEQEEIFGPVLSVMKFSTHDEAVKIANNTRYGLAAMIWTNDLKKANLVSYNLQAGTIWINTYGAFHNEVPFGGVKDSGFGRELGHDGLLEYTQTKSVITDLTPFGKPLVSMWFSK